MPLDYSHWAIHVYDVWFVVALCVRRRFENVFLLLCSREITCMRVKIYVLNKNLNSTFRIFRVRRNYVQNIWTVKIIICHIFDSAARWHASWHFRLNKYIANVCTFCWSRFKWRAWCAIVYLLPISITNTSLVQCLLDSLKWLHNMIFSNESWHMIFNIWGSTQH